MRNYQRLFQSQIWKRGYDYYYNDCFIDFSVEDDMVLATIDGTSVYDVSISFHNGEIQGMECNCPYAMDGNNCKHMAAVVIKLHEEDILSSLIHRQSVPAQLNNGWETLVYKYFHGNKNKYINSYNAIKFDKEFSMLLVGETMDDIMYEKWKNLFSSLHTMLEVCNSINPSIAMPTTNKTFHDILQRLQGSTGALQFAQWIPQQFKSTKRFDFLKVLLDNGFTKDQLGIQTLDMVIDAYHKQKNFQCSSYCLKLKTDIMEGLKYNPQDILTSIAKYHNYGIVKDYEIKCDIQSGRYTNAKEKLNAYLRIPSLDHHKRKNIIIDLMQVSLLLKEYDSYLENMILLYKNNTLLPIKHLKDLLDFAKTKNEYEQVLEKVYQILRANYAFNNYLEILMELELFDTVIYELYHCQEIDLLIYHEDILKKFDSKLYDYIFYYMMITALQNATMREQYYRLYHILLDFKKSQEDELVINDILIYAHEQFSQKRVLMEILDALY